MKKKLMLQGPLLIQYILGRIAIFVICPLYFAAHLAHGLPGEECGEDQAGVLPSFQEQRGAVDHLRESSHHDRFHDHYLCRIFLHG